MTPYGYKIVSGKAVIIPKEVEKLHLYFDYYMSGDTMAEAARKAKLPFSSTTLPYLMKKKEYVGTEYYPAIITADYQAALIAEWERRKDSAPKKKPIPKKGVKIYTNFRLSPVTVVPNDDPADSIAQLYQKIRPVYTKRI